MRNSDTTNELNDRDARIVAWTLAGKAVPEIAVAENCAVSTIYRRLQTTAVRQALSEARAAEVAPLVAQAVGEVRNSVAKLVEVRDAATTRDGDRIKASVAIIEWFKSVFEMGHVLPRIAAIEATLAAVNDASADGPTFNHPFPVGPVPPGMVADDIGVAG